MKLLHRDSILSRMSVNGPDGLFIDPLLDDTQVGEVSLDLRLGTDFLVSLMTRKPSIDIAKISEGSRGISSYFRTTRRDIGDKFILYPNQVVLATTLEYIGLPSDIYVDIIARSSYNRLGIHHNTMIHPGWRGCFPLELFNHGNNPIELVVGGRLVQARFFEVEDTTRYHASPEARKYYGNVRPMVSRAQNDSDLDILKSMKNSNSS